MEPEARKLPIRFYEIDLLRFLAALAVVFFHYTYRGYMADDYSPIPYPELGRFTKYGYLGVELFFIISGYVVLLSAQGKTVRQFFLSRITRLYPAFWIACTLTFLVEHFFGTRPTDVHMAPLLHSGLTQYAFNMTMLYDFFGFTAIDGAYWSLTVEITFYFLVSLLIGYGLMRHLNWFLAGWLLFAALPGVAKTGTPFAVLLFPQYAPYFAAGMIFYLFQQPSGRTWLRWALLLVAYLVAVRGSMLQAYELTEKFHDDISRKVVVTIVTSFFIMFYLVAFRKVNLSRFTWLAWPGALTYPLYLLHSDIAFVAFHRIGYQFNKYVLLGGVLAVMLIGAYLIHVLGERRLSKPLGAQVNKWLTRIQAES